MRLLVITVSLAAALPAVAARAEGQQVNWPTFFRVGPSMQHQVVGELVRGTMVDVQSCTGDWCQVRYGRATGYVKRAMLGAGSVAIPAGGNCFESRRAGYGAGERLQFCGR